MSESPSPAPWSTVAALPELPPPGADSAARPPRCSALQILVLDHLREIEARRLHLTRGYGSLFDYVVHELGYTAAAAWRRIKAMRLCEQTNGARELLQARKAEPEQRGSNCRTCSNAAIRGDLTAGAVRRAVTERATW